MLKKECFGYSQSVLVDFPYKISSLDFGRGRGFSQRVSHIALHHPSFKGATRNGALIARGKDGVNRSAFISSSVIITWQATAKAKAAAATSEGRPKQHCREQKAEWRGEGLVGWSVGGGWQMNE